MSTTTDSNGFYSFSGLLTGSYQVFEVMQDGWTNITSLYHNLTATPGASLTNNNFTNFKLAKIIVHKNVLGTNGQTDVVDNTGFTVKINNADAKAINETNTVTYDNLAPGTYTISETGLPSTHSLVSITNNGSVTVTSGGVHHVYIVNKQNSATLTVIKEVVNDNVGTKEAKDFTMNLTGTNLSDNSFAGDEKGTEVSLDAGNYSVDESSVTSPDAEQVSPTPETPTEEPTPEVLGTQTNDPFWKSNNARVLLLGALVALVVYFGLKNKKK